MTYRRVAITGIPNQDFSLPVTNSLYKTMGFHYVDESVIGPLPYERETIVMAMTLRDSIES